MSATTQEARTGISAIIAKFRGQFARSKEDLERAKQAAERSNLELRRLEAGLADLTNAVTRAHEALQCAESQFAQKEAELQGYEATMLEAWSHPDFPPNYNIVAASRAATEDFPRVRQHLAAKVESARQALKAFEKRHAT